MIELIDIRYVRLGTADLAHAVSFATKTIGLELVRSGDGHAYLRGDDRDHNVYYFEGDPTDHTVGFEQVADAPGHRHARSAVAARAALSSTQHTGDVFALRRFLAQIHPHAWPPSSWHGAF